MTHTKRSREEIGPYTLRGIIDFSVFATTNDGRWYEINTHGKPEEWAKIPTDLQDTLGGAWLVAVSITNKVVHGPLEKEDYLVEVTDEGKEAFLTESFGDS